MRPHILVTGEKVEGLRSLEEVKTASQSGHSKTLFLRLKEQAERAVGQPPLLPSSTFPGRDPIQAKHANRDYGVVQAAADRILDAALVALLTNEEKYTDTALEQLDALFDESRWPEWRDQSHPNVTADLRTGQLGQAAGLAYDWLYPLLSGSQRNWMLEGIDRCGVRRYLQSVEEGPFWLHKRSNWQTCVVGGLGMAGMALGDDHPESGRLVEISLGRMEHYLEIYGPKGEFNENPGYASATRFPVFYFTAYRYFTNGGENRLAEWPFPEALTWYMYMVAPPGRMVEFGDLHVGAPPGTSHYPAVASATGNGLFQWFYLNFPGRPDSTTLTFELLSFDEKIEPVSPEGILPRGQTFPAHGGCISSRSDWNPQQTPSVLFSKAGHGSEMHGNHDAGQLCVHGYGERLIIDLGSPPLYPRDFFGANRYQYYNASVFGHNVLMFDGREMAVGEDRKAVIAESGFDDDRGGWWTLDTTGTYDEAKSVKRTVIHLTPHVVAVLDRALLPNRQAISLRWHTANRAGPDADGNFLVESNGVQLAARIVALDGQPMKLSRNEHRYEPPFDKGRLGDTFDPVGESYVEATLNGDACHLLTLFAVFPKDAEPAPWQDGAGEWFLQSETVNACVTLEESKFIVRALTTGRGWEVKVS